jgi:glucoamylase
VYTVDDWATSTEINSRVVGYPGSFVDVAAPNEVGTLEFTLFWPATADAPEHWLGRNYKLAITAEAPETMPAGTKPVS